MCKMLLAISFLLFSQFVASSHRSSEGDHHHHHHQQRSRKVCTPCEPSTFFQHQRNIKGEMATSPRAAAEGGGEEEGESAPQEEQGNIFEYAEEATSLTPSIMAADVIGESTGTCKIRVTKLEKVVGKCVALKGGVVGCQSDRYLDPANADCEN